MKVILLTTTYILLLLNICGQKRIGFELSPRFFNINATMHYQQVFYKNFLFSSGISFGSYGMSNTENNQELFDNGFVIHSPFPSVNESITESSGTYTLLDYFTQGKGIGIQIGLGYFHEFSVIHGIRMNLYSRLGYMDSRVSAYYYSVEESFYIHKSRHLQHFVSAVSLELNHTIRISGRNTMYYGIKLPYYFSPFKKQFHSKTSKDLFSGLEPEISIGITRVIGSCD